MNILYISVLLIGLLLSNVVHAAESDELRDPAVQLQASGIQPGPDTIPHISDSGDKNIQLEQIRNEQMRSEPGRLSEFSERRGQLDVQISPQATAGASVTATITYVTGQDWIPGSAIAFSHHWLHRSGLQASSSQEPAYIEIVSIPDGVEFDISYEDRDGVHGGLESIVQVPRFTLIEGDIPANTTLTFHVSQLTLPESSLQEYELPAYIRLEPGSPFVYVPGNKIRIEPDRLAALSLSGSSLASPGELIDLWVRLEDQFGNLVTDRNLSLDLLVNGTFKRRVDVSAAAQMLEDISFDLPGVYQLEIRTGGGGMRALSNPVMIADRKERIIWADIGTFSSRSDGDSSQLEIATARQGRYDLIVPADHSDYLTGSAASHADGIAIYSTQQETGRRGSLITLVHPDGRQVTIGLAEQVSDLRFLDPNQLRLAQIVGGSSVYSWFGDAVASQGYRSGFVAINHSHQYPRAGNHSYTAIVVKPGQTWFEALAAGQTFVSIGEKITLLTEVESLGLTETRNLALEVLAANPVASIELIKNGQVLTRQAAPGDDDKAFTFSLTSSSRPYSGLESRPRNGREWIGYVATRDSPIEVVSGGEPNWLIRRGGSQRRVDFLTHTHGDTRSLSLSLSDPTPDTVLEVGLAPVFEDTAWIPEDRLPREIPAQRFLVPLAEMQKGAVRLIDADGYVDRLEVRPAPASGDVHASFSFVDRSRPRIGDFYYFKVNLSNGSSAYSSPLFVEGSH